MYQLTYPGLCQAKRNTASPMGTEQQPAPARSQGCQAQRATDMVYGCIWMGPVRSRVYSKEDDKTFMFQTSFAIGFTWVCLKIGQPEIPIFFRGATGSSRRLKPWIRKRFLWHVGVEGKLLKDLFGRKPWFLIVVFLVFVFVLTFFVTIKYVGRSFYDFYVVPCFFVELLLGSMDLL